MIVLSGQLLNGQFFYSAKTRPSKPRTVNDVTKYSVITILCVTLL
jgi:hypothetical protein